MNTLGNQLPDVSSDSVAQVRAVKSVLRLRQHSRWNEAIALAESYLQQFPRCADLHRQLAACAVSAHREALALEHSARVIDLEPECDAADYCYFGLACWRNGDIARGREALEALVRARPQSAPCHHLLGAYLRRVGDTAGAILAYERAIELSTSEDDDRWGYYKNLSNLYREVGRLDDALAALKQTRDERSNRRRRYRKWLAELAQHNTVKDREDGESRPE